MQHDLPDQQVGDKIRIKVGDHKGKRGVIIAAAANRVEIALDDGNAAVVDRSGITNFSLAARKAWRVMPKKAGRPKNDKPKTKMVSLRLDVFLWIKLGEAVTEGIIVNKEAVVNALLEEYINKIFGAGVEARPHKDISVPHFEEEMN